MAPQAYPRMSAPVSQSASQPSCLPSTRLDSSGVEISRSRARTDARRQDINLVATDDGPHQLEALAHVTGLDLQWRDGSDGRAIALEEDHALRDEVDLFGLELGLGVRHRHRLTRRGLGQTPNRHAYASARLFVVRSGGTRGRPRESGRQTDTYPRSIGPHRTKPHRRRSGGS